MAPASLAWRGVTGVRNTLYDRGVLHIVRPAIPVISIGNLSVGGTGKTPVSAWVASELVRRGAHPAVVMRGYGDDEPRVHALLNPDIPIVVNADRVAGVHSAAGSGADVAVLDDGFQHRRVARVEDVVLVSADRWREPLRALPAGPWREGLSALSRATLVVITRKAAGADAADGLLRRLSPLTRTGAGAVMALELEDLRNVVTGEVRPLSLLRGSKVLLAAGIADPDSMAEQLRTEGADIEVLHFPDHHAFDDADIVQLARRSSAYDHILCTLKDAVKLGPRWPREAPPPWYVSQRCRVAVGTAEVSTTLDRVLAARKAQIQ
jgi:tetraacyldisaccharide 4'-kinase